jgi:hypothetical protein
MRTVTAPAAATPTQSWLAALQSGPVPIALPPLEGPAAVAEKLLLLLHYGVDWENGWAGSRRKTYWDRALPDRVICATYLVPTLSQWWCAVTNEMESAPRNPAERLEVAQLLGCPEGAEVLGLLRNEAEALVLRVRIIADAVRAVRAEGAAS